MNIFGIGIDIIEIDRIENAIKKNPRFLERNFTEKEVLYFKENNLPYVMREVCENAMICNKDGEIIRRGE